MAAITEQQILPREADEAPRTGSETISPISRLQEPPLQCHQARLSGSLCRHRGLARDATNAFSWRCPSIRAQDKPVGNLWASRLGACKDLPSKGLGLGPAWATLGVAGWSPEGRAFPPRASVFDVGVQGPSAQPRALCGAVNPKPASLALVADPLLAIQLQPQGSSLAPS